MKLLKLYAATLAMSISLPSYSTLITVDVEGVVGSAVTTWTINGTFSPIAKSSTGLGRVINSNNGYFDDTNAWTGSNETNGGSDFLALGSPFGSAGYLLNDSSSDYVITHTSGFASGDSIGALSLSGVRLNDGGSGAVDDFALLFDVSAGDLPFTVGETVTFTNYVITIDTSAASYREERYLGGQFDISYFESETQTIDAAGDSFTASATDNIGDLQMSFTAIEATEVSEPNSFALFPLLALGLIGIGRRIRTGRSKVQLPNLRA